MEANAMPPHRLFENELLFMEHFQVFAIGFSTLT